MTNESEEQQLPLEDNTPGNEIVVPKKKVTRRGRTTKKRAVKAKDTSEGGESHDAEQATSESNDVNDGGHSSHVEPTADYRHSQEPSPFIHDEHGHSHKEQREEYHSERHSEPSESSKGYQESGYASRNYEERGNDEGREYREPVDTREQNDSRDVDQPQQRDAVIDEMEEDFRAGRPRKDDDFEVRFEGVPLDDDFDDDRAGGDDADDSVDARADAESSFEGGNSTEGESSPSAEKTGEATTEGNRDNRDRFDRNRPKFQKKKEFQKPGGRFEGKNKPQQPVRTEGGNRFDPANKFGKNKQNNKPQNKGQGRDGAFVPGGNQHPNNHPNNHPNANRPPKQGQGRRFSKNAIGLADGGETEALGLELGELANWDVLKDIEEIEAIASELAGFEKALDFNKLYRLPLPELRAEAERSGIRFNNIPTRTQVLRSLMEHTVESQSLISIQGLVEVLEDGNALLAYPEDNYRIKEQSAFLPKVLVKKYGLQRGHFIKTLCNPPRAAESAPYVLRVLDVNGLSPETISQLTPFTELVPYYPTERIMMEREDASKSDAVSMRVVDLLTPVGLGQRGLIVAPPRTGKTVLMQGIANSIAQNKPGAKLIILLIDERPEEVTDFRRNCPGEVVASTFDEAPESHVHAAEMVIEKARRMVEAGDNVVILLDSITRLARAYNALMPSSGKILSGGVEASALQKPKRFFGSARNIEGGGSLTILGTALVETGSRMDEVVFEEFKGTGNMELHLDRALADKRIFPSLSFERCGTRKEELLYHPEEMLKVYGLRRAMKGVPSTEAMEMLITRVKKTKTNAEFLLTLSR